MRNVRKIWGLIVPLISILIFFGCVEIFLYAIDFRPHLNIDGKHFPFWAKNDPDHLRFLRAMVEKINRLSDDVCAYEEDLFLGYRLRPGLETNISFYDLSGMKLEGKFPPWSIVTDRNGHRVGRDRSRFFSSKGDAGFKKVVFMGGSSIFGWGTDYENTVAYQLESMVRECYPDLTFQFINYAVPGYAMIQHLRLLKKIIASRELPDMIVLDATSNCGNPASVTDKERERIRLRPLNRLRLYLEQFRFFQFLESLLLHVHNNNLQRSHDSDGQVPREPMEDYEENLQQFINIAKNNKIKLIMVGICAGKKYVEKMIYIAQRNEISYINFYEIMHQYTTGPKCIPFSGDEFDMYHRVVGSDIFEKDPSLYLMFPDKCHPNPTGHRILALALMQVINKEKQIRLKTTKWIY